MSAPAVELLALPTMVGEKVVGYSVRIHQYHPLSGAVHWSKACTPDDLLETIAEGAAKMLLMNRKVGVNV